MDGRPPGQPNAGPALRTTRAAFSFIGALEAVVSVGIVAAVIADHPDHLAYQHIQLGFEKIS